MVFLLLSISQSHAQTTQMSLDSDNPQIEWKIKPQADINSSGREISMPGFTITGGVKGVVPGVVFTSYVDAGIVPNPDYGDNIYKVDESFFNRPFWYRTEFTLPANYAGGQHVWLHFDNTNRYADFYFNGVKLSGTSGSTKDVSGHMLRTKYDVTSLIHRSGKNAIAVLITDANQKKRRGSKEAFGISASPTYLAAAGWDWIPYIPGRLAGITGNVYLTFAGDVTMEDPWVRSDLPALDKADVSVKAGLRNASSYSRTATITGLINPGNIRFSKKITIRGRDSANIAIDKNDFEQLVIHHPKLWWPNGYGDPNLYTCTLTCSVGGKVSDARTIPFGIRKYEYKMIDNVAGWPVLTFFINGQKLFLKGGDWGMSEYLLRCHGKDYEVRIRLHKDLNYNMIRLWTGCVTDDAFYDYCDKYGIMVWDDFWLYVAFNQVEKPDDFKKNALDKVLRLRNHACIAIWCGANETHPAPDIDAYLRDMIAKEDGGDRMYKSCSNQDGLSGSGWWGNQPPEHHFETSGSNLAWNKPPYPYGIDRGYGLRTEIGTATFPTYESVKQFIPAAQLWPLPSDEELKNSDTTVWNRHFFGKEASNATPVNYKKAVNTQFGKSSGLEQFCEKAQILNIEVVKGMYEAWNDKMWHDASGLLLWMSQSAYPSFVWQTYDYYYDPTGAYWGAKKACEPLHIQWNALTNSVKVINTTSKDLKGATAKAIVYNLYGKELRGLAKTAKVDVSSSNTSEAFVLNWHHGKQSGQDSLTPLHFIRLELRDANGKLLSDNFYWRNGVKDLDYTALNTLPAADLSCTLISKRVADGRCVIKISIKNHSRTVAFANRIRMVNKTTSERVLPVIMSDDYVTLMPGEEKNVSLEADTKLLKGRVNILLKQFAHTEKEMLSL